MDNACSYGTRGRWGKNMDFKKVFAFLPLEFVIFPTNCVPSFFRKIRKLPWFVLLGGVALMLTAINRARGNPLSQIGGVPPYPSKSVVILLLCVSVATLTYGIAYRSIYQIFALPCSYAEGHDISSSSG